MQKRANRWLMFIIFLIVMFLFFVILLALAEKSEAQEFPYKQWKITEVRLSADGLFYIVFQNPDPVAEVKAVVIVLIAINEFPLMEKKPEAEVRAETPL